MRVLLRWHYCEQAIKWQWTILKQLYINFWGHLEKVYLWPHVPGSNPKSKWQMVPNIWVCTLSAKAEVNVLFMSKGRDYNLYLNCSFQRVYCSSPRWYMCLETWRDDISKGSWRTRKNCPSVILSTTDPNRTYSGTNPRWEAERLTAIAMARRKTLWYFRFSRRREWRL
jgi:hypothetical protein